jgi:hypothetical protein
MIDMKLWHDVQRIAYPKRSPSNSPPFTRGLHMGPKRKPASWLYYLLLDDAELRAKVLP